MSRLTNFAALWISGAMIVLYLILYATIGREDAKFVADWLVLIGATFMAATTFTPAMRAVKNGGRTGSDQFLISFWLIWTFVLVQRIWLIVVSVLDRPDYLTQTPIGGLIAMMIAIAAGYGIAAPLTDSPDLPRRQIITMAIATLLSGVVAGMAIGVYVLAGWVQ